MRVNGKPGVTSLSVRLPVDLYTRVSAMAKATDHSLQGFVETALRSHVARRTVQISPERKRLYAALCSVKGRT